MVDKIARVVVGSHSTKNNNKKYQTPFPKKNYYKVPNSTYIIIWTK